MSRGPKSRTAWYVHKGEIKLWSFVNITNKSKYINKVKNVLYI